VTLLPLPRKGTVQPLVNRRVILAFRKQLAITPIIRAFRKKLASKIASGRSQSRGKARAAKPALAL
jgi:hypothetical protein